MAQVNFKGVDVNGLLPALDRRKPDKPFVVDGRNFVFDVDGPKSAFGGVFLTHHLIADPLYTDSFDVDGVRFIFSATGVFKLDATTLLYFPIHIFSTPITGDPHKWTTGFVNDKHFFCHPGVGVIYYDTTTELFSELTGATVPTDPQAVAAIHSRLVILGTEAIVWSAQDDGTDLATDLATGAGFQALSLIGGTAITCVAYTSEAGLGQHSGIMTFTTAGIMLSKYSGTVGTFQHSVMSLAHKLINSFCVVTLDTGEIVFGTETGLHKTRGQTPEKWALMFSEFLVGEFNTYDLAESANIRFTLIPEKQWFFISFTANDGNPYTHAYVLYLPTERLGYFTHWHYAIMAIDIASGPYKGQHWGHLDIDGRFLAWRGIAQMETEETGTSVYLYKPLVQYPVRYNSISGVYTLPSVMRFSTVTEIALDGQAMGYYDVYFVEFPDADHEVSTPTQVDDVPTLDEDWNLLGGEEDWGALAGEIDWNAIGHVTLPSYMSFEFSALQLTFTPTAPEYTGLDSLISVGLLRYEEQEYPDELGLVTNLSIGMPESGDIDATSEDWNVASGEEDWNSASGEEDWGEGVKDVISYGVTVVGTNDGYTEYMSTVPDLAKNYAATNFYTLMSTGIWHTVDIDASSTGQSFHLKSLELSGNVAGRL